MNGSREKKRKNFRKHFRRFFLWMRKREGEKKWKLIGRGCKHDAKKDFGMPGKSSSCIWFLFMKYYSISTLLIEEVDIGLIRLWVGGGWWKLFPSRAKLKNRISCDIYDFWDRFGRDGNTKLLSRLSIRIALVNLRVRQTFMLYIKHFIVFLKFIKNYLFIAEIKKLKMIYILF